jgi:hypothetical protein
MGKFTLATILCTWSPNEVTHCLVSSARSFGKGKNGYMKAWYDCNYSQGITLWLIEV